MSSASAASWVDAKVPGGGGGGGRDHRIQFDSSILRQAVSFVARLIVGTYSHTKNWVLWASGLSVRSEIQIHVCIQIAANQMDYFAIACPVNAWIGAGVQRNLTVQAAGLECDVLHVFVALSCGWESEEITLKDRLTVPACTGARASLRGSSYKFSPHFESIFPCVFSTVEKWFSNRPSILLIYNVFGASLDINLIMTTYVAKTFEQGRGMSTFSTKYVNLASRRFKWCSYRCAKCVVRFKRQSFKSCVCINALLATITRDVIQGESKYKKNRKDKGRLVSGERPVHKLQTRAAHYTLHFERDDVRKLLGRCIDRGAYQLP